MSRPKFFYATFIFNLFFLMALALLPVAVLAQSDSPAAAANCAAFKSQFNVTVTVNGNSTTTNLSSGEPFFCTASDLIIDIIQYALAISGTVTILFLMVGGFWYLTSAGNEEQTEKGKKTLINAVIGLVVIVLAFAIVKVVSTTLTLGK